MTRPYVAIPVRRASIDLDLQARVIAEKRLREMKAQRAMIEGEA